MRDKASADFTVLRAAWSTRQYCTPHRLIVVDGAYT